MASPTDRLQLKPSRRLQGCLAVLYAAVLAAPFFSRLEPVAALLLDGLILLHAGFILPRELWLRGPEAVVGVRWEADGRWYMSLGDGGEQAVRVGPRTLLLTGLCLLELHPEAGGRPRRVPILGDSGEVEAVRRLRVRLRFWAEPAP